MPPFDVFGSENIFEYFLFRSFSMKKVMKKVVGDQFLSTTVNCPTVAKLIF